MAAPRQFPVELDEFNKKFQEYKEMTRSDPKFIPDFAHFLALIDSYPEEAFEVIKDPVDKNIPLVKALKKAIGWFIGEYSTNPNWRGQNSTKGIWLQKQLGYTDKQEVKQDTKATIEVSFKGAGADPFG